MKALLSRIKQEAAALSKNNDGVGIVEVILILVVLIAIVLIFKNQIMNIITSAFQAISNDSGKIIS